MKRIYLSGPMTGLLAAALYRSMVAAAPVPSQVDRQPSHWAEPGGATITAEVKAHNEMVGGAPAAAAATYTAPLFPQAPAPADAQPVALPDRMEHGFHPMAHEGFRGGWNSCIDAVNKLGPLYPHPDTGDIERLEDELALLSLEAGQKMEDLERERDALRAQLACAVDALNEVVKVSAMYEKPFEIATLAIGELSASAELAKSRQEYICTPTQNL